jgi:hypothetical protein
MSRPFLETLRELRAGRTLEDLGTELTKLIVAVKSTGKSGEITLKLKIKPPKNGAISYLTIEDQIITKEPKLDRGDTVFFPTADNGLSRQDPSQSELPFKGTVDTDTGEIRSAS